ncbi:MAG: amidohydrolase [Blastocatellia bacterium]|nr:amidohydrolase [Blastocatellia bacterium]
MHPTRTVTWGVLVLCFASTLTFASFSGGKHLMAEAIRGPLPGYTARDAELDREIRDMFPKLVEMRRDFHVHPELSNREERTARIVAERLQALGLEVKTGVARHGVIGLLKGGKPGPVVAVRADMDALPILETHDVPYKSQTQGVMHACGHDVHTTVGLGVAEVLAKHKADLAGTVKFIFQPAEEGPPQGEQGGARLMIKEGALENPKPQVIFGLHCMPTVEVGQLAYNDGATMASADRFFVTIRGTKVHGAYPHKGVDAVVVAANAVTQLQTIRSRRIDTQEPLVLSIGSIHGGNRFNIIADEVKLEGTLRTLNPQVRQEAIKLMHQTLKGITEIYGSSYELTVEEMTAVTINNTELVNRMLPTMKRIVGESNISSPRAQMGAEDFSYFAEKVPGFFYFLGVGNQKRGITAMIHTPDFDVDEDSLVIGVKTMSAMVFDYLDTEKSGSRPK